MRNGPGGDSALSTRLHAAWVAPALRVWGLRGEVTAEPIEASALQQVLGDLSGDGLIASAGRPNRLALRMPTLEGRILLAGDGSAARIAPVSVAALSFSAADAVDLLTCLRGGDRPGLGDSIRYWRMLAEFVIERLAHGQFVPSIEEGAEGSLQGRWRLVIRDEAEFAWLESMVSAMPPVCRAFDSEEESSLHPARLVDGFLQAVAEAYIRRSLSSDSFFVELAKRAEREGRWELAWLSALVREDRRMIGEGEELASIAEDVQEWIGGLFEQMEGPPPRLRFALREPEDETEPGGEWRIEVECLEVADGDALDLEQIWSLPASEPSLVGQRMQNRRAQVVGQLRRAASVFPEVRKAMAGGCPTEVRLTNQGAHAFLREAAPLLAREGFEVVLPEWAARLGQQLGLHLRIRPRERGRGPGSQPSLGALGLGTLLDFDWTVAVGEERLSVEEFEQLCAGKSPLVRIGERWLDLDREAAERALKFLTRRSGGGRSEGSLFEALHLVGGMDEGPGLPIVGIEGADWIEHFLRAQGDVAMEALPQPAGFHGTLRPYQARGLSWLSFLDRAGIGSCLADDMGLGKTIQLIALLLHEREAGGEVGPTLLFAPMSVVGNWEREIERFAPSLRVLVHHGPLRLAGDAFVEAAARHDVVLTTYGLAHRELRDLQRVDWHRIALDEAQKIKNPNANQTLALRSLKVDRRVALTGTPVENHLSELWSIMDALNPGLLGSAGQFRTRFAVPIEKGGDAQRADQLRRMIHPFVLRRLKSDPNVLQDLPEKMEMRVYCNLTPEQAGHYERIVNELLSEVDSTSGIRRRGLILAALTRLKQVCNHPAHLLKTSGPMDGRSGKCERLVEMLEEVLEEGDAALVFTQYREMGDLLHQLLTKRLRIELPYLHGGLTARKRQQMIDAFQEPASRAPVFLLSLRAGGFGLNLTKANHVFHFDRWWNPAVEEQATDRAHRIGQTRRVQVHKFVCIGTVEERIDKLLTEKSALAARIVGSGDEWLTGLSTVELRENLTLCREAIAES